MIPEAGPGASEPPRKPPGDLPPVQPPTVGFILQLFVIPMVIVTIIVVVWLLFNWLAHMGSNPSELVRDLKRLNDVSWQRAYTLADLLRDSRNAHLKKDVTLARDLADVLEGQIRLASMEEKPIQLRMFLCLALGEFLVPEVLPTLIKAATTERNIAEVQVRRSALQALAVFITNNDAAQLRANPKLVETLLEASRERSESDTEHVYDELRSTAAFALGMLAGNAALDRLNIMLGDAYPNARYNATIGLSRHGDVRAIPGLLEMIDPENDESVRFETDEQGKPWKRLKVMQNGLRAAKQLMERNSTADLTQLAAALEKIKQSDLEKLDPKTRRGIKLDVEEALIFLKQRANGALKTTGMLHVNEFVLVPHGVIFAAPFGSGEWHRPVRRGRAG